MWERGLRAQHASHARSGASLAVRKEKWVTAVGRMLGII